MSRNEEKIEECLKLGIEKDTKIEHLNKEKSEIIAESEEAKFQNKQLQMRISGMQANKGNIDASVQALLKDIENKEKELGQVQETLNKERNEKSALVGQYNMTVEDRNQMNDTLQREVELLKAELDQQLTSSNIMKNSLEMKLQEKESELVTLNEEKAKLEQSCEKYETEIRDRIKENLNIMDDYDNVKAVELKQLNFINELTKSNQELTTTARRQQVEIEELKAELVRMENEIKAEKTAGIETSNVLDTLEKKNQKLEESMTQTIQSLTDKDDIIARLVKHKDDLETKLQHSNETLNVATMARDQYKQKLQELDKQQLQIADDFQKEKENFDTRDKEQTEFLNQLVKDLENCKERLLEKTQMVHDMGVELTKETEKRRSTSDTQMAIIKDLEQKLVKIDNKLATKEASINKLTEENRTINEKLIQKLETLETLKLENTDYKKRFEQAIQTNDTLTEELNLATLTYQNKENECENLKRNIHHFEESAEQQGNLFNDLHQQNEALKTEVSEHQNEANELKERIGECVEKYNSEIARLKDSHLDTIDDLQKELENSRVKSQREINELLNNFNEVENELSFCQEELTNKSEELNELRSQLLEMTKSAMTKEQKLLQDLETLNEQNENILQSEIKKYKAECENQVLVLQKQNTEEMDKIRKECQDKIASMRKEADGEKSNAIETLKGEHNDNLMQVKAECDKLKEDLESKSISYTKIENDMDSKLRSKEAELTSKNRIIDQLGRRIETQQKLVEYMMKSLEVERSKQSNSNGDIMQMLSNLQSTIDDKFDNNDVFRSSSSLSSFSEDTLSPRFQNPPAHSSPMRGIQQSSTSEVVMSPLPSPTPSPVRENFGRDDFCRYLASSPSYPEENQMVANLTYPWTNASKESGGHQQQLLSKSMPESGFVDMGYASPTMEKNTNTRTIYFGEQIQTIMKTFEKIEAIQTENSPNKELNLGIWKQKIHFRLKVLEDQMSDVEGGVSGVDGPASEKRKNLAKTPSKNNVLFHPSTQEIRDLIDNVNRRYQKLGRKYLASPSLC